MKQPALIIVALLISLFTDAQMLNREDSLNAGLDPSGQSVILSGYGEAKYSYNLNEETARINLTRAVLFVGYRFNDKITFFSELEVEDAKVDGGGGELAIEQCVLKFDLNKNNYLLAGLFIPRIGMINENHLPVSYNGNDRPMVERWIIPSTWRELGIGYYGNSNKIPGLNWSLALMNGLNAEGISGSTGIREARFEGRDATASNLALTGSVLYFVSGLRFQVSGYYGGSVGLSPSVADTLGLAHGPFGTPVALGEMNVQFSKKGFTFKALGAYISIPDAGQLNDVYHANAARSLYGYMAEVGYNLLETTKWKEKELTVFARYEVLDLMSTIPDNALKDDLYNQQYISAGLTYLPIRNVAVKFDWKHLSTGEPNYTLHPDASDYTRTNDFFQLGIAYSF